MAQIHILPNLLPGGSLKVAPLAVMCGQQSQASPTHHALFSTWLKETLRLNRDQCMIILRRNDTLPRFHGSREISYSMLRCCGHGGTKALSIRDEDAPGSD